MPPNQFVNRPGLCIDVVHHDGAATVVLRGELDIATAPELGAALAPLATGLPPASGLVIDAGALSFVDAAGLSVVVRFRNELRAEGHQLWVVSARPWIRRVFEISGLDGMLRSEVPEPVE